MIVSKIFDNADFGYDKTTVERPLRLNFQASKERIALLDDNRAFKKLPKTARKARLPARKKFKRELGARRI